MTPANLDITIRQGVSFGPIVITCNDADGTPVDLTGWSAFAHVRVKPGDQLVADLHPQITDAVAGKVMISLTHAETAVLSGNLAQWDLILETEDGVRVGPIVAGKVVLAPAITQPA